MYTECALCPRECRVDRSKQTGFCGMSDKLYVARASLHMWEEPCISGTKASGTVFFTGCNLKCVYCQNKDISEGLSGKGIDEKRLCEIFFELEAKGAHNINLVTPDHFAYHIYNALVSAKDKGLKVPIVYNTSGYCSVGTLKMFDGLIDVYLTDFKYIDENAAKKYSSCENYPLYAKLALSEMVRQRGACVFEDGLLKSGVIVRHLVLPKQVSQAKKIVDYVYDAYGDDVFLSVMNQFTPNGRLKDFPEIDRKLKKTEYERVLNHIISRNIKNVYIQEDGTASESFIPSFDNTGV